MDDPTIVLLPGRIAKRAARDREAERRAELTHELMSARRAKKAALDPGDDAAREAGCRVDSAEHAVGGRGLGVVDDGSPALDGESHG